MKARFWFVGALFMISVMAGCSAPPSRVLPPERPAIPVQVRARIGASVSAFESTSTGGYSTGVAVVGPDVRAVNETFTVASWIGSDSTRTRALAGGAFWEVLAIVVRDQNGAEVYSSRPKGLIRGGGPVLEALGRDRPYFIEKRFALSTPGRYEVQAVASYRIRKLEATGQELTANQFDSYRQVTPPVVLTVR